MKIINLIKGLSITHINQVWTTDITYIKTINEGNFFLISFIDLYSKKVVSWGLYNDQKTEKVVETLNRAIAKRKPYPGLICHSDKVLKCVLDYIDKPYLNIILHLVTLLLITLAMKMLLKNHFMLLFLKKHEMILD